MSVDPSSLKVDELKQELSKRGLPVSGRKADLVSRLQMALDDEEFGLSLDTAQPVAVSTEPKKSPEPAPAPVVEAPKAAPAAPVEPEVATEAAVEQEAHDEPPAAVPEPPPAASGPEKPKEEKSTSVVEAESTAKVGSHSELADRIAARIRRFGVLTKEAKVTKTKTSLQARAERFGLKAPEKTAAAKSGGPKKKGKGKTTMEIPPEELAKLEARKRRFASVDDQKMAARAARFASQS